MLVRMGEYITEVCGNYCVGWGLYHPSDVSDAVLFFVAPLQHTLNIHMMCSCGYFGSMSCQAHLAELVFWICTHVVG